MNHKSEESLQKLRGGYYTPGPIANFLSKWVMGNEPQSILEPSCGDGRFLKSIYNQVKFGQALAPAFIDAVELIPTEAKLADKAANDLRALSTEIQVINHDFFDWIASENGRLWDAIVGNPPYIRYQYFDKDQRNKAKQIFKRANVPFTKLTNAWVPFIIASIIHLTPGGRLAMVVPAELLHVLYAHGLRLLLEQEMETINIIHFREIVFSKTLQGVVLLLGIKRTTREFAPLTRIHSDKQLSFLKQPEQEAVNLHIYDIDNQQDLQSLDLESIGSRNIEWDGNWMLALLDEDEISLLEHLKTSQKILLFKDIADVSIGIVTGANQFFVVNDDTLKRYKMKSIAVPMLAKSKLIQGIRYNQKDHLENLAAGRAVHFLKFPELPKEQLEATMAQYIEFGELKNLQKRYKCRIRNPWYVVPYVWTSKVALLKRCHLFPRLVLNEVDAYSTDTAYRISMKLPYAERARDMVGSFLNSLTFIYAELLGRHYGGGVLELVPSEIRRLPIPLVNINESALNKIDSMIRDNAKLDTFLDYTDEIILKRGIGLDDEQIYKLRKGHKKLMLRRLRK